jgi:uncharacterized damage-inducible protein DinB
MTHPRSLADHVSYLLRGRGAHAGPSAVLEAWPAALRGERPPGAGHSAWELLEHLRIAQRDILEYSRRADHVSPEWPRGYWPEAPAPADERAWEDSRTAFLADLEAMQALVVQKADTLLEPLPHIQDGPTLLREALLLADHNSYHLGQLVALRRRLGAWPVDASSTDAGNA